MKTLIERTGTINFKKVFTTFFVTLGGFAVIYILFMAVSGYGEGLSALWNRLTFTRFRERMFTDMLNRFRFFAYIFLIGFHAILALWVYVDGKKHDYHKASLLVLTLFTGLIGWLVYMIGRVDKTSMQLRKQDRRE